MSAESRRIEEELRSQLYAALFDLTYARTEEKAAIVERLSDTCLKLNDLIIHGIIPELERERRLSSWLAG